MAGDHHCQAGVSPGAPKHKLEHFGWVGLMKTVFLLLIWIFSGDFQNRNLGPNPFNQVNPIYFFPAEEMVQNSPGSDVSPFFDENVGFTTPLEYEYLNYSDCS